MTTAPTHPRPQTGPDLPVAEMVGALDVLPIALRLPGAVIEAGPDACERWFWELAAANQEYLWQMELAADGVIELMPPTYPPSDEQEGESYGELREWNIRSGRPGIVTGPTSAFRLANGAIRSPDVAWTTRDKIVPPPSDPPRARPYCPDFVVEIRSTSQRSLQPLLAKMREYMDNGAKLGWLIDPLERTVRVYRAGVAEPELLAEPDMLDGEEVLPGFTFAVRELIFDLV